VVGRLWSITAKSNNKYETYLMQALFESLSVRRADTELVSGLKTNMFKWHWIAFGDCAARHARDNTSKSTKK
jgi:hypothetical protein